MIIPGIIACGRRKRVKIIDSIETEFNLIFTGDSFSRGDQPQPEVECQIPSGASVGDFVVWAVMTRTAIDTPLGWTRYSETVSTEGPGGVIQRVVFFSRYITELPVPIEERLLVTTDGDSSRLEWSVFSFSSDSPNGAEIVELESFYTTSNTPTISISSTPPGILIGGLTIVYRESVSLSYSATVTPEETVSTQWEETNSNNGKRLATFVAPFTYRKLPTWSITQSIPELNTVEAVTFALIISPKSNP